MSSLGYRHAIVGFVAFVLAASGSSGDAQPVSDAQASTEQRLITLAEILGIPEAYSPQALGQIRGQLGKGGALPVTFVVFNSEDVPSSGSEFEIVWDDGSRQVTTDSDGTLSVRIDEDELDGWALKLPPGYQIRPAGDGPVRVVTQVVGSGDAVETFESVPKELETYRVGGLTVRFPEDQQPLALEALVELGRIQGHVESQSGLDLGGIPYGIALVDTDASNLRGTGLNIPVPITRWRNIEPDGGKLRWVLVHEWVEFAIGVDRGLYLRDRSFRFVGDGLAELYAFEYTRRFYPDAAEGWLSEYVSRVKKLMESGEDTYSFLESFLARVAIAPSESGDRSPRRDRTSNLQQSDLSVEASGYAVAFWLWKTVHDAAGIAGVREIQEWLIAQPEATPETLVHRINETTGAEISLTPKLNQVAADLRRWQSDDSGALNELNEGEIWFSFDGAEAADAWTATTPGVMQNRPDATVDIQNGKLVFAGGTSPDQFELPVARTAFEPRSLPRGATLILSVKGDGQSYGVELRTNTTESGRPIWFRAEFETDGGWQKVIIEPDRFRPFIYGRATENREPTLNSISGLSIVALDADAGDFRLEINQIGVSTLVP